MSITCTPLAIPDVKLVVPTTHGDDRGLFAETYTQPKFVEAGIAVSFVQDNHAVSAEAGTLRGLHFQTPPYAQDKLVRVVRGAILDVAVDIRRGSPTFGQHVSATLSADNWHQIFVPAGFAHGLLTLEPDTHVIYKVSGLYSKEHDKGVLWNDPALDIDWGIDEPDVILSDKDKDQPQLADCPDYFHYGADQ